MQPRFLCAVISAVACTSARRGSDTADPAFTLQLRPLTPLNQADLFDDVESFILKVDRPGVDDDELYELDRPSGDASVSTPMLPALSDAAIAVYGMDGDDNVVAYGRSSAWTLPDDGSSDVPLLMGRVDSVGRLTDLPGDSELVGGGLTSDGQGGFIIFGGDEDGIGGTDDATNNILRFDVGRPNTSLSFVRLGELPDVDTVNGTTATGLAGHTVTRLFGNHDYNNWMLIAGGAQGMNGSSTVTDQVSLWDPETDELLSLGRDAQLPTGVYHHTANEFGAGYVSFIGGAQGRDGTQAIGDGVFSFANTAALFEPRSKQTQRVITGPENGPLFLHASATVDNAYVLVCGGLEVRGGGEIWYASDACDTMSDDAVLTPVTDTSRTLPLPLSHHTMTALPDGRVLLVGGFTTDGEVGDGGTVRASDAVWLFDDAIGWTYVGALNVARGMHSVAILQDGTALIVGGTTATSTPLWSGDDATGCIERINPAEVANATLVGSCDDDQRAGELPEGVIMPMVGSDPDYGVFIVGGADSGEDSVGHVSWFVGGLDAP